MNYEFAFEDTPEGQVRFLTLLRSFIGWTRSPANAAKRTKEMRPREAAILAQFHAISAPVGPPPDMGEPDIRLRKLNRGGGSMQLDGNELAMLVERVDEGTGMLVEESQMIESLVNWLKGVKNTDAKPGIEHAAESTSVFAGRKKRA